MTGLVGSKDLNNPTEEERKDYDGVIEKFNGFFKVRKNVIFERALFNRMNQLEGESVELYRLAGNCEYGTLTSDMIRDRIVVGIRDSALSQRLQLDPNLTLETAKKMVRQWEAVGEQQNLLELRQTSMRFSINFQRETSRKSHSQNQKTTTNHRSRAHDVARNNMQGANAQQEMQHAIDAKGRDTTKANVSQKQLQNWRTTWTRHTWTQP